MTQTVLKRYAPFYIALIVTGVATVLLFLRPQAAVGFSLLVEQPANVRNSESGFRVLDPTTGKPDVVPISSSLQFDGEPRLVKSATLDIEMETGDPSFKDEIGLNLPLEPVTGDDITDQLANSGDGSSGSVSLTADAVKKVQQGINYFYGYDGIGETGGIFTWDVAYVPPPFTGDYRATIRITTEDGNDPPPAVTRFSVLGPLLIAQVLSTLYPRSDVEALPDDLVILQVDFSAKPEHLAIDNVTGLPKVTATGQIIGSTASMMKAPDFHPSLLAKWEVDADADVLLPLRIPNTAVAGFDSAVVTVEDIAGQTFTTTAATSPSVKIASTRSVFNVYFMPVFNFITPALQCSPVGAACTAAFEFVIAELLKQTVKGDKINPAFLTAIDKTAADDIPMSQLVEKVFSYDPQISDFRRYNTDPLFASDLDNIRAGLGYILKTKATGDNIPPDIEPFVTNTDPTNRQHPTTAIPVPFKLPFTGKIVAKEDEAVLPTTTVEPEWNLVGAHAEIDTTVGVLLAGVTVPLRLWEQVLAFRNELDISLDENGRVRLNQGKPEIVFERKFQSLLGPDFGPEPSGDTVEAGAGLWLFMCEAPASDCKGGEIGPILQ